MSSLTKVGAQKHGAWERAKAQNHGDAVAEVTVFSRGLERTRGIAIQNEPRSKD